MSVFSPALRSQVLVWLEEQVPPSRVEHCLRVEAMAKALARAHGLPVEAAAQAGLMHDLAKYFKPDRLLALAQAAGLTLDPVDLAHPHLLHADVSALVARQEFNLQDEVILAAIANHTLGQPGMDGLSCVVFLADSLEPGRGDQAELNRLRQVSQQNLVEAVLQTCDYTFKHLLDKRQPIHPRAVLTRNWFLSVRRSTTGLTLAR